MSRGTGSTRIQLTLPLGSEGHFSFQGHCIILIPSCTDRGCVNIGFCYVLSVIVVLPLRFRCI